MPVSASVAAGGPSPIIKRIAIIVVRLTTGRRPVARPLKAERLTPLTATMPLFTYRAAGMGMVAKCPILALWAGLAMGISAVSAACLDL